MKPLLPFFFAATLLAHPTLDGAVATHASQTAPTQSDLLRLEAPSAPSSVIHHSWNASGTPMVAQSFYVATAATLERVTLAVNLVDTSRATPFTFSVHQVASATTLPDSGNQIFSDIGTLAANLGPTPTFLSFEPSAPISLEGGHYYVVALRLDDSEARWLQLNLYPREEVIPSGVESWSSYEESGTPDLYAVRSFSFYLEGNFAAVPEPSAAILLLPMVLAGWKLRRRHAL